MTTQSQRERLEIKDVADVPAVALLGSMILDEAIIKIIVVFVVVVIGAAIAVLVILSVRQARKREAERKLEQNQPLQQAWSYLDTRMTQLHEEGQKSNDWHNNLPPLSEQLNRQKAEQERQQAEEKGRKDQEQCELAQQPRRKQLEIKEVADVTVVSFVDKKILDEANIQIIGEELFQVVDEFNRRKVVLDFQNVEYLSSAALGKLITLHRKLNQAGGKLLLCGIDPQIYGVFEIGKFNRLFAIVPTLDEALAVFGNLILHTSCPVYECKGGLSTSGHVHVPADPISSQTWTETCAACRTQFQVCGRWPLGRASEHAQVLSFAIPTYDSERIEAGLQGPCGYATRSLKVIGRLDLFAAEALEKAWRTLPPPRRVLFDLRQVTELSPRAIQLVLALCATTDEASKGTILIDRANPEQAGAFLGNELASCEEAVAWRALAELPGGARPLTVEVKQDRRFG